MTPQEMVAEFHRVFSCPVGSDDPQVVRNRIVLIRKEYRKDGKVLKGENYKAPDMTSTLKGRQ